MRRLLIGTLLIVVALVAVILVASAAGSSSSAGTYKIQFDNAFGLVSGAQIKVAGVPAGKITAIDLDQRTRLAVVSVDVTQKGFGSFRSDAFCQSRPQSLIGEFFIDCQPGQNGKPLPAGSTIPVTQTQSTIPADLLLNVMRMPERERLSVIINELGAAAAGRSGDLQAALRRAVPALSETDNLLSLLAKDSRTLQQLTTSANTVVGALADNKAQVQRFVVQANNTAQAVATQQANLRATFQQLPGFLQELRPAMAQLGAAADANEPVFASLNSSATQIDRLFASLPGFLRVSLPALRSLGRASVTGKAAVQAAQPTVQHLNQFARSTPGLSQNLAIVLHDLDDRSRAVEADSRSPGGKGYTGLEALLQYVFNQTLAINTFGPFGHLLAVDSFVDPMCSPYATPATIALSLQQYGSSYRRCYAWLGPSQPGVNEVDPSNRGACVPDPGGAPPGERGPRTSACKLTVAAAAASDASRRKPVPNRAAPGASQPRPAKRLISNAGTSSSNASGSATNASGSATNTSGSATNTSGSATNASGSVSNASGSVSNASGSAQRPGAAEAQQLLNYLLAP